MTDDTIPALVISNPVPDDALERRAYTVKTYGALPVKPKYSSYEVYQTVMKTQDLLRVG